MKLVVYLPGEVTNENDMRNLADELVTIANLVRQGYTGALSPYDPSFFVENDERDDGEEEEEEE